MPVHLKIRGAFFIVTALLLSACATPAPPAPEERVCPAPPPSPEPQVQYVRDPVLEQQVTRQQLELMERDARIDSQQLQLEEALQEVVSTLRKLRSAATRAEAASAMAETDVAMQSIGKTGRESPEFRQATRLMQQSSEEFKRSNYGGALFLAKQAKASVRLQSLRGADERRPGEVLFASPVKLRTTTHSNVRSGPGTDSTVAFTTETGAALSGLSYVGEWIRVIDEPGNEGWIYAPLVVRRQNAEP